MRSVHTKTGQRRKPAAGALSPCGCGHRLPAVLIKLALKFGRVIEAPGMIEHVVDEPELRFWRMRGIRLEVARGVRVFCGADGRVLFAYRAHDCDGAASSQAS